MKTYLAIDIGASSGRHIVGFLEGGKLVTEEVYRFENGMKTDGGKLTWDIEKLYREILYGIKAATSKGFKIDYIGIDTWAVDYVLLDKYDHIISPVYAYRDVRGEKAAKKVHEIIPFEKLYYRSGIQYQPFNTVYQLYDDKLGGRLDKAETMLMLPDYLNFKLTGVKKQEYTNATSTALVNAETHVWDSEIIDALGLKKSLFGELSQPASIVGKLMQNVQEATGCTATVLLPATHDTASAVLAAPINDGRCYISSGTWSLLGVEQQKAHTDETSRKYNYSNEGSTDFTFRFQKNIMGLWMIQRVRDELGKKYSFAQLAEMASEANTDITVDVNDGSFLAPSSMIEEINAAAGKKCEVGELADIIFKSLAKCYAESIAALENITGEKYDQLSIIGGGCNNTYLNRLTAIASGKTVMAGPAESTAIGNIAVQMIAAGEVKSIKEAREIIEESFDIKEVRLKA